MQFLRKISTGLRVLREKSFAGFCRQLKVSWYRHHLERRRGEPFVYSFAGMRFACFPDLPDSCEVFVERELDYPEDDVLREWLKPGDLVLDAGANVGLYTWRAHYFLRGNGTFIAIDASERICEYLSESVRITGLENVHICHCALGDEDKEIIFYEALPGCFSVEQSLRVGQTQDNMVPVKTRMMTLGQSIKTTQKACAPALIKLDIEGAEVMALSAAPQEWLSDSGPLWIVEINPDALERFESTPLQVLNFFPKDKFQRLLLPKFPKTGGRSGLSRVCQRDERFADALFYNLVAIPLGSERKLPLLGVSQIGAES